MEMTYSHQPHNKSHSSLSTETLTLPLHNNYLAIIAAMPAKHYVGLGYAWIPALSAVVWFGGLVALLSIWTAQGKPRYMPNEGTIVYISDVGANQKPLFIVITSVTAVSFVLSLALERWLRHKARLDPNLRRREKWLSVLAIIFAAAGGACLISLSIRDAFNHNRQHWHFTIGFIVCVAISVICTTAEWGWLDSDYESARMLKFSYALKLVIIILAIICAIILGALFNNENHQSIAAVFEWLVAFLFDVYLWTLVYDLYPAVHTKRVKDLHSGRMYDSEERTPPPTGLHQPVMRHV